MQLTVSGVKKEYEEGITLPKLFEIENVETPEYVTVSINEEFIPGVFPHLASAWRWWRHSSFSEDTSSLISAGAGIWQARPSPWFWRCWWARPQ